jgi:hypothetical protein
VYRLAIIQTTRDFSAEDNRYSHHHYRFEIGHGEDLDLTANWCLGVHSTVSTYESQQFEKSLSWTECAVYTSGLHHMLLLDEKDIVLWMKYPFLSELAQLVLTFYTLPPFADNHFFVRFCMAHLNSTLSFPVPSDIIDCYTQDVLNQPDVLKRLERQRFALQIREGFREHLFYNYFLTSDACPYLSPPFPHTID